MASINKQKQMAKRGPAEGVYWQDGLLKSRMYDDLYCSKEGGDDETRHVFIGGNNLIERWATLEEDEVFTICELGFGTGLNFLTTVDAWIEAKPKGRLVYLSYELHPLELFDVRKHLEKHDSLSPYILEFSKTYRTLYNEAFIAPDTFMGVQLQVLHHNALDHLPKADFMADAWYLDGFAPTKNPELWDEKLMQAIGAHTNTGGTVASYSAARTVKDRLAAAGFEVSKQDGFGKKRDMVNGILA
ncbi:MAG: tRNA (5-methylaminomethyl-2-thiouridine)(34)-methyltransferase MnmD [Alphaproteobacteria bacterium]|nr:tRNA (5-methylaminomethyl-2-thiouridine)(34)-methyltransferase MnmD [Alphaproteobacteria bacterium]